MAPDLAFAALAAMTLLVQAPTPPAGDEDAQAAERMQVMLHSAAVYELTRGADAAERLELQSAAVLRWNNPVSGVKDGIVAMWTSPGGRPEVVAQVFLSRDGVWMHEFQSLSEQALEMTRSGREVWAPADAGVAMKPVPNAPQPANGKAGRLVQMGRLAREFTASVDFKVDFRDEQTSRYELRLLSRPLYRYGGDDGPILDGALYAFVQGTNPEVFLLLEARETEDGAQWHYGMAPMTGYSVRAEHTSGADWESENKQKYRGRTDLPYMVTRFEQ